MVNDIRNLSDSKDSLILIDELDYKREKEPIHHLNSYTKAIVKIIKESEPKFTIGVYGEWGNGKTTLMKRILYSLENDKDITSVWFNAWRYEREEYYGITALLKSIAIELDRTGHYKELTPLLKRSLITLGKDILRQVASQFITEHGIEDFEKNLLPKLENLPDVDKDSIYFDGLRSISEKFREIRSRNPKKRIVVFVDDLDRCSPKKALELFESIKAFLDIEGFIYVIGLSHETVSKIITQEYNIHGISGEDYIKKIIQIPIHTPNWISGDIKELIRFLINKLNAEHRKLIDDESFVNLITESIEKNPREIKRFLNNLIVALEIFKDMKIKLNELLIVQILNMRWNRFYNLLMGSEAKFRDEIWSLLEKTPDEIIMMLESDPNSESYQKSYSHLIKHLKHYSSYDSLWNFLVNQKEVLKGIDWKIYHMAVESSSEIPVRWKNEKFSNKKINEILNSEPATNVLLGLRDGAKTKESLYNMIPSHTGSFSPTPLHNELNSQLEKMLETGLIRKNYEQNETVYSLSTLGREIINHFIHRRI